MVRFRRRTRLDGGGGDHVVRTAVVPGEMGVHHNNAFQYGLVAMGTVVVLLLWTAGTNPPQIRTITPLRSDDDDDSEVRQPSRDCLVHEPLYINNVVRHPKRKPLTKNTNDSTAATTTTNADTGEYLIQPTPPQCGTLRRTIWKTGYTIVPNDAVAYEIEQRQTNCSAPVQIFHLDNQNGLGAHLHLWSQAYCNLGSTNNHDRIKTYNPHWLWRDPTFCPDHTNEHASPWNCYFPHMEDRCPNDDENASHHHHNDHRPNVTSPYHHQYRCPQLQWPHQHSKTTKPNPDDYRVISEYRAATTEYIFQSIHPLIVQEAERHIGWLFGNNNAARDDATVSPLTTEVVGAIAVPPDMITVHLRWGDKFFEMDLVPIPDYVQAILDMLQMIHDDKNNIDNNNSSNNRHFHPVNHTTPAHIYLATEDPRAVTEFLQYTQQHYPHWTIYVDRTVTELTTFRPNVGNRASWTTRNTHGRAGFTALGSLLVALESRYYILTTGSNWSRLLNELRLNVIEKRCCPANTTNCTRMIDLRPGEW